MLITTAFDFPGYETVAVQGEIFGLIEEAKRRGSNALVALGQLPHQDAYELRVSELQPTQTIPGAPPR